MTRVRIIVEGQTEESFIKNVLAPTLWSRQVYLTPTLLGPPGHKGGNVNYARVRKDIILALKQDRAAYCSTMLDLYGLGEGFPGMPPPPNLPNIEKVTRIEQAMSEDIATQIEDLRPDIRFVPYLQLHEFEGLLFSDPSAFARGMRQPNLAQSLQHVRDEVPTPEDIDDDPQSAPSKRVLRIHPPYRKPLHGTSAAVEVGISSMRQECAHFRNWLERLERLAEANNR